jgi:hypothetical protein
MLKPDDRDPTDEERTEVMHRVTSSDGTPIAFTAPYALEREMLCFA